VCPFYGIIKVCATLMWVRDELHPSKQGMSYTWLVFSVTYIGSPLLFVLLNLIL